MESTGQPLGEVEGVGPAPVDEGELRLGSSERGVAANGVILALTRAARSFLLYDPANEAIRHFLQALRTTVESYLATYGELPLVVRPFELVVGTEVVYLDRDRERSLAFRLYRDGVRRVTLGADLTWHELLKLLEILSIRYTGVRQAEDDVVVLLWKAGFTHIQLEAVEGFVPEEELGDTGAAPAGMGAGGSHIEAPADFDLPLPTLTALGPLRYRALAAGETSRLLEEDSNQALPELCVRLSAELLAAAADPTDSLPFVEIVPQLREIRDFLLAEGLLASVLDLVTLLASSRFATPADAHERDVLLASFGDERGLGRLLRSVPRDATTAPPEMVQLLDLLPGNHLRMIVQVLGTERGEATRRVARSLMERYVARQSAWIIEQITVADPAVAGELLRVLAIGDPTRALDGVQAAAVRPEIELQLEALHVLEHAPTGPIATRLLTTLLGAPSEEVRIRALDLVGRLGQRPTFSPLVDRVKRDAALRLSTREAEAIGEALARCDPFRAQEIFREWLKPRGMFSLVLPGHTILQRVAVAGLVHLPGDDIEALVKQTADRAGSELAAFCTASLVKRRRLARGLR
jgi:hypothetical protein